MSLGYKIVSDYKGKSNNKLLDKIRSHVYSLSMNESRVIGIGLAGELLEIGKVVMLRLDAALEPQGLSTAKLWALHAMSQLDEPPTITFLAECMKTTKSNVTAMIDRLEADGLVTRTRSSEDRRTVRVELTEAGRKQHDAGMIVMERVNDTIEGLFAADELALLRKCIQRVK